MQASVPELVMRTFCTLGTSEQISLRHRDFERIRNAEAGAVFGGGLDGGNDFRMRVAENGRSPGADVVDVFVAIHVPDARALGFVDEERLAADGAEGADGRVHAAGNVFQGFGEKRFGFGSRNHGLTITATIVSLQR